MNREAAARAIEAFLRALGRDPDRDPELAGTGARVADAFVDDLLGGYRVSADALLASSVVAGHTSLVVVRDLEVTTMCPHHLMPASGVASVAFAPNEKLVGIGTIGAVVDAFAHRLALQEQVGEQVAATIARHLSPTWTACKLVLSHTCMTARGERKHGAKVETFAFVGAPEDRDGALRALGGER
jgi:GTP cyclohydrolase I